VTLPSRDRHLPSYEREYHIQPEEQAPTRLTMIRLDTLGALALRGSDGGELRSVLTQPKRLALLCYLAVESPRGFQRRDRLFGLFWPELSQAQARQALRQSLYFLRHALGDQVVSNRGANEIGIDASAFRCDVRAFTDLYEQGLLEDALALYHGDFLAGFFVDEASPAFEHWLYATRDELRQRAIDAAWRLADRSASRGAASEAAHWARHASRLDPDDERSLQRLVRLLDSQGDRAGALRAYADFAESLATEFAAEPSAETHALIEAVRNRTAPCDLFALSPPREREKTGDDSGGALPRELPHQALPLLVAQPATTLESITPMYARRTFARHRAYLVLPLIAVVAVAAVTTRYFRRAEAPPMVAVGWVQDPSGADTGATTRTFAELLATDLARVPGLRVVSHARLYDMLGQHGARDETPSAISDAARRAGASQLVEAVLSRTADSTTRLDLRRVDLATGATQETRTFRARTVFELADRATAQVATDFRLRPPVEPLTEVTTMSLAARRLYEEGLRTFYSRDVPAAVRLFHAALDEDSTFAMAAYYAGVGEEETDGLAARRDLALALRLANHASDRERLIIRQTWAYATNAPAQLAIAESLAARYPGDVESEFALGRAMAWSGNFLGAIPHLKRVIRMDSLSLAGRSPWCHACDALELAIAAYIAADSMGAAERMARDWVQMQPRMQEPWWFLASMLARENRYDSALATEHSAERLSSNPAADVITRVTIAIGAGQFAVADQLLSAQAQDGNSARRSDALWWLVISLRNQGRLHDALAVAEQMVRTSAEEPPGFSTPRSLDALAIAQVHFEMGHFKLAAAQFDSISSYEWQLSPGFTREAPGLVARHRIWMTTHVATALAAAHDTTHLASLADSVALWSTQSAFFRDRALDHYVRGLLLEARGAQNDAEREFRSALVSPIDGYSRVNLELAKVLIARGRPRDAIAILQAPLHGSLEASNYYLTQTDLEATLADAFDRASEPDSALVQYRRVLAAWQGADPEFRPRVAAIQQRVRALSAVGQNVARSRARRDRRASDAPPEKRETLVRH
jgi:DNA-binding SARP family transcriptional activator/tetratricopeptide (TPR) repeat protein